MAKKFQRIFEGILLFATSSNGLMIETKKDHGWFYKTSGSACKFKKAVESVYALG